MIVNPVKIPDMYWSGWFTLVLPLYVVIAAVIGWLLRSKMLPSLNLLALILVIDMGIAFLVSWYLIRNFSTWQSHIVAILLLADVVFIITTALIAAHFLGSIRPIIFLSFLSISIVLIFLINLHSIVFHFSILFTVAHSLVIVYSI